MTDLSPAAQAMLDAYHQEALDYIEDWGSFSHKRGLAAALEAVADQAMSPTCKDFDEYAQGFLSAHVKYRSKLLAIAAELRGDTTTTETL